MKKITWAAIAARNQVEAPANVIGPNEKKPQHPAMSKDGEKEAAAAKMKPRAVNTAPVNNIVASRDVIVATKSRGTTALTRTPSQKRYWKKKKAASVSRPPKPPIVEASRKAAQSKKKGSLEHRESVSVKALSIPANVPNAPAKKSKPSKQRNKGKNAEIVEHIAEQGTLNPITTYSIVDHRIPGSDAHDSSNEATAVTRTDAASAAPDNKYNTTVSPLSHIVETGGALKVPSYTPYAHMYIGSTRDFNRNVVDTEALRSISVMARPSRNLHYIRPYVDALDIPGISYDQYGVCIAPDAPEWVRGRIARKVQLIVRDLKMGKAPAELNKAYELERERMEKAHFDEPTWDLLFKIESRGPTTKKDKCKLKLKLRDFNKKLAAGLTPNVPVTLSGGKVGKDPIKELEENRPLPLPTSSEQNNMSQGVANEGTLVPSPVPDLPPPFYYAENTAVSNAPMPVDCMMNGHPYDRPFFYESSQLQQYEYNPQQHDFPYKLQPCHNYASGYCYFGANCHFLHAYPHELQAAVGLDRRDAAQESSNASRSVSQSSTSTGMVASQDTRPYSWGNALKLPSCMPPNTYVNTPFAEGSQCVAEGSFGGCWPNNGPHKKKKKTVAKKKGGKKSHAVNK